MRLCLGCPRCRYVSSSSVANLCAWYAHCDMDDLRHWWSHHLVTPWRTVQVRSRVPLAKAIWQNRLGVRPLRLAIATLAFGTDFCPFAMWCQSARRLKTVLQGPWRVQLVILWVQQRDRYSSHAGQTDVVRPPEFCPEAEVVPADDTLRTVARKCLKKGWRAGYHTGMPLDIMLKWQFVAMTTYDAVLFVDSDADMFPRETRAEELRARWQQMLPIFLRPRHKLKVDHEGHGAGMRLLVCTDLSSPVNTGLMLLRPSTWLYQDGLRVLGACPTNETHG